LIDPAPEKKPRKPRSASGQGGYFWREKKALWEYRVTIAGSRHSFYGRTQAECRKKTKQAEARAKEGLPALPERITVAQWLIRWLQTVAEPNTRDSTYNSYQTHCRLYLIPALGRKQLARLGPEDLQALYAQMQRAKRDGGLELSAFSARQTHAVIHNALAVAADWGIVPKNVAEKAYPPVPARPEYKLLSGEQSIRVLELVKGTPLDCLITLALTTGMREAELLGLRWADVDLRKGTLNVRQQAKRAKRKGWTYPEPKSDTSRRTYVLTPQGVAALHRQERYVAGLKILAGERWEELDLVMPNRLGRPIEAGNLLKRWYKFLESIGLGRVSIHELRHSVATLLKALGVKIEVIQEILGHSQVTITASLYADKVNELHVDAMKRLGDYLEGAGGAGRILIGVPIGVPEEAEP
jgi:integrase